MKKIFKLTTFSFVGPFIATFFVVLFILVIQFLWKYIDDLVGKGLEWYIILQLLFYASATFVPLALPLSILLSSIMSFGKLAETYELVALKSAGVSLLRIMVPLITVVATISVGAFFFSNDVIPKANLKYFSLLWDVTHKRPALNIPEGVFYNEIDNYSIRVDKKDKTSSKISGITIYDHTRPGNDIVITAKRGEMETTKDNHWMILKLYDGHRFEEMPPQNKSNQAPTHPASRLSFESYEMKFDLSVFKLTRTKEDLFKEHHQMMRISQLRMYEDSLKKVMVHKRADVKDFTRPYFMMMRDSTYYYRNKNVSFDKMPQGRSYVMTIPLASRRVVLFRALSTARTLSEVVRVQAEELDNYQRQVWRYQMEQHRKYAIAFTCITLFFIGAPLGAIIRKGGLGMPTVVSIFMFVILYILNIFGERSAKEGGLSPFVGMWLSTLILMPVGLILTYRANIDKISLNFGEGLRMFFARGRYRSWFLKKDVYNPESEEGKSRDQF